MLWIRANVGSRLILIFTQRHNRFSEVNHKMSLNHWGFSHNSAHYHWRNEVDREWNYRRGKGKHLHSCHHTNCSQNLQTRISSTILVRRNVTTRSPAFTTTRDPVNEVCQAACAVLVFSVHSHFIQFQLQYSNTVNQNSRNSEYLPHANMQ